MPSYRLRILGLVTLSSLLAATAAFGQNNPPNDRTIDINLFEPALGARAFLTVGGAEIMSPGQFQLSLGVSYMTHPLTVFVVDSSNNLSTSDQMGHGSEVISSMVTGDLGLAYGVTDWLQGGLLVPVVLSMQGDGLDAATGMADPGGLKVSGVGDARLEATFRLYARARSVLAVIPAVTLPTSVGSGDGAFLGEKSPTFRPRLAWQWTTADGKLGAGANLGLILRKPRKLYNTDVGQQVTYGVAAAYHITKRFDVLAEVFGRKGFTSDLDVSPLEADGALRLAATKTVSILVGGGGGLVKGVGAPTVRLFASVSWAPDYRDNDHDGIVNMNDACPNQAEDKDGFQDEDGCPDLDNDGDGVPDAQDKCPNVKEDLDGFQDDDGCPDPDNDGDGIPDEQDGCPNEPEDKLPPRPDDGCPAPSASPEGAAPAPQGATVPPAAAPAPAPAPATGTRIEGTAFVLEHPLAFDGKRVRTAARAELDTVAKLMKEHKDIGGWVITVTAEKHHSAGRTRRLGRARAEAVRAYLIKKGVPKSRLHAVAGSGDQPGVTIVASPGGQASPPPAEPEPTIEIEPPQ